MTILQSLLNEVVLASMTIRNLDEQLKRRLRIRAATHGHSMEDEARNILRAALSTEPSKPRNLAQALRARIAPFGGVKLDIPSRDAMPPPVNFG